MYLFTVQLFGKEIATITVGSFNISRGVKKRILQKLGKQLKLLGPLLLTII
jgi:hypothetical protein